MTIHSGVTSLRESIKGGEVFTSWSSACQCLHGISNAEGAAGKGASQASGKDSWHLYRILPLPVIIKQWKEREEYDASAEPEFFFLFLFSLFINILHTESLDIL